MQLLNILSVVINAYAFAILIRLILGWVPSEYQPPSKVKRFFTTLTEPYLRLFRALKFLRIGAIDFSPLIALTTLSAFQIVLAEWPEQGAQSLILFPLFFASAILNIASLFSLLICIAIIFRTLLVTIGIASRFCTLLDRALYPIVRRFFSLLRMSTSMSFTMQLAVFACVMFVLFLGFRFVSAWLFLL